MKLVYVVTEDWFFYIHRIPTLRAALDLGIDVTLLTNVNQHRKRIEAFGIKVVHFPFNRKSKNPFSAVKEIAEIMKFYNREKPDIVHHIALKPVLFGSLAAYMTNIPYIVNGYVGLGSLFYSDRIFIRFLRILLSPVFRLIGKEKNAWTLFENEDDRKRMIGSKMAIEKRSLVIPGSGVDINRYTFQALPETPEFICMFAGRMIAMKGLQTIRDAFQALEKRAPHIKLWLCGTPDPGNPESWTSSQLTQWQKESQNVIYKGYQPDMAALWPLVHLALQPTIGEGLPVSLLEAGACARPMIATNVPGCREIVKNNLNGFLIREQDAEQLADRILALEKDRALCLIMGQESRKLTEERFSSNHVTAAMKSVYQNVCKAI